MRESSLQVISIDDNETDEDDDDSDTPFFLVKKENFKNYFSHQNILVVVGNTSSCRPYGVSTILQDCLPHANIYRNRDQLFHLTRAIKAHRGVLGSAIIRRNKSAEDYPRVAYLLACYSPGPPSGNGKRPHYNVNGRDTHYINGMKEDTAENRSSYLQMCLDSMYKKLKDLNGVRRLVFIEEYTWGSDYSTKIENFARAVYQKYGMYTIIVQRPDQGERQPVNRDEDSDPEDGPAGVRDEDSEEEEEEDVSSRPAKSSKKGSVALYDQRFEDAQNDPFYLPSTQGPPQKKRKPSSD